MLKERKIRKYSRRNTFHAEDEHGSSNWAISYGDMVTLLLAFFVLFFSTSKTSKDITILVEELKKEYKQIDVPQPNLVWGAENRKPTSEINLDQIGVNLNVIGNKIIVEFPKVSFFDSSSYSLNNEGELALKKFGTVLKRFTTKMRVVVRGYTDNRPVKHAKNKIFKDNLELSSLRAISALRVLNKEGIPYHLLRIGGYGETDKSAEVSNADVLKYDRKIVLVIEELDKTERNLEGLYTNSKENLNQINSIQNNSNQAKVAAPTVPLVTREAASVEEVKNEQTK